MHQNKLINPSIIVACDDADVFLLLLYYFKVKHLSNEVYLEETTKEMKIVSIRDKVCR